MALTIRELRNLVRVSQASLAQEARINRYRLSCAELGLLELTPREEQVLRSVLADISRARHAALLSRLRE